MTFLTRLPVEQRLVAWWKSIDGSSRAAFLLLLCVNVLAFGFEMTNLTLHHDDLNHILIEDTILGYYLGRFGHGWLHYYTQNHHVMPFLQMVQGIAMMSAYGIVVARFWGARQTTDLVVVGAIVCVFPYMAHVYQYNTAMVAYPAAHLLAALAVVLATRGTLAGVTSAAVLFVAAFSIYQGVASVAATMFVVWLVTRSVFGGVDESVLARGTARSTLAVLIAVGVGGAIYLAIVSTMNIPPDTIHSSDDAFHLRGVLTPWAAIPDVLLGSRAFFRWPEPYFPAYLKNLQLAFLVAALAFCLWLPRGIVAKLLAAALLLVACFTPRALQLLHPKGHYHTLTLTGYALVVAASAMIAIRSGRMLSRNVAVLAAALLVAGYVVQCNWISTVGYLNTLAHYATFSQMMAQLRSQPDAQWDGRTIAVTGRYEMTRKYPMVPATGVATSFLDAAHMSMLGRLVRDPATFVSADASTPGVREFVAGRPAWPHPSSVGVVDGVAVIVLAKTPAR